MQISSTISNIDMKIYHNPRCKKSRAGLAFLLDQGTDPEVREYLKDPLSENELNQLVRKLGMPAMELVRKQEEKYRKDLKGKEFSEKEWIQILVENPKLIRRPIIEKGKIAVIGDPVENIQPLL
jgi:arsenate reductase (glutaredoxin)